MVLGIALMPIDYCTKCAENYKWYMFKLIFIINNFAKLRIMI